MAEKTTSVGQLYEILIQAFHDGDESKESRYTWHETLRAKTMSYLDITKKLGELFSLFEFVKQELLYLDEPYCDLATNALFKIQEPIITYGLTTKWSDIKKRINEADLSLLKMCDGLLISKRVCQNYLHINEIGELSKQVNELINEFKASELPIELKSELIKELIKIQIALNDFDVKGEANLQSVCIQVTGSILRKSSQYPKLYKRFIQPVHKVVNTAVMIGGLMTTFDLSIKYQPFLTTQIIKFVESLPDEPVIDQPLLESSPNPQEIEAIIDKSANHKVLTPSEEKE